MSSEKTLFAILKFGLDKSEYETLIGGLNKAKKSMSDLENEARKLEQGIAKQKLLGKDYEQLSKQLVLVNAEINKLKNEQEQLFRSSLKNINSIRETAEKLEGISIRIGAVGYGILQTYSSMANKYAAAVGETEQLGKKWIDTNKEIENAQIRLGRVAAQTLQPYQKTIADLLDGLSGVAEKSPQLSGALAALGGLATAAGGVGGLISQGLRLKADISLLAAAKLQDMAANKMLTAAGLQNTAATKSGLSSGLGAAGSWLTKSLIPGAAAGVGTTTAARLAAMTGQAAPALFGVPLTAAGGITGASLAAAVSPLSILGGVGLGLGGYEALAQSDLGKKMGLANLGQYASVAASGIGSLTDAIGLTQGAAKDWFLAMGQMTGVIEDQADAAKDYPKEPIITNEQLQVFADYQAALKARQAYEKESETRRTEIVDANSAQRLELETGYEKARSQVVKDFAAQQARARRDFGLSEARAEQEHYKQRQEAAQGFGVEAARMEADHQREMRKLQDEHADRSLDALQARDALAFIREQRDYEKQRGEAESQYGEEARRKNQDYARQMQDLERNFAENRARRLNDFATQQADAQAAQGQRLAQMEQEHREQLAKFEQQAQQRLDEYQNQYNRELEQLRQNEQRRSEVLNAVAVQGLTALQYEARRLAQENLAGLQEWIGKQRSGATSGMAAPQYGVPGGLIGPPAATTQQPPRAFGVIRSHAAGGYAEARALYEAGEQGREFILNNTSTRTAERLMGRRLNQQDIVERLAQNTRGGSTLNLSFPGGLVTAPMLVDLLRQNNQQFGDQLAGALAF